MANNAPEGYYRGRNGQLYPIKRQSILDRFSEDPDAASAYLAATYGIVRGNGGKYGPGYEILDPAPSRERGKPNARPRAITAGYNADLMILVIEMRDGKYIAYKDVYPDVWDRFKVAPSTNEFIEDELYMYDYGNWTETQLDSLDRTKPQNFQLGTEE
jgi:hypothetical protein